MKPCLINVYSEQPGDDRFFDSLEPYKNSFTHETVKVPIYPGNVYRFFLIPEITDNNQWYIFSDTTDVIMQAPLPDLSAIKRGIIVANENELHKNSFWKPYLNDLFKPLSDKTIYNGGLFAMKGKHLKKYIERLIYWQKQVPSPFVDQLALNMFCHVEHPDQVFEHPYLFTTLYANMEKGIIMKRGDTWINDNLEPFTFVHANGSTKMYL